MNGVTKIMKITVKDKSTTFSDIKTGEVFAFESNIYIKTSKLKSELANAVRLATGDWICFDESTPVNRVNAEVVIRCDEE